VTGRRKIQLLLGTDEHARLVAIADAQGVSLSELVRAAVRERFMPPTTSAREAVARICALQLPVPAEWDDLERQIDGLRRVDPSRAGRLRPPAR
jgi:hypothetical protein